MADVIEHVDVAVTVIHCQGKILLHYNPKWGSFSLPMTKIRPWEISDRRVVWQQAAFRNVSERLGHTTTSRVFYLMDVSDFRQSDHDGKVKRYHFQVFHFPLADFPADLPGPTEWLAAADILAAVRKPISPTADFLLRQLIVDAQTRGTVFPPPDPPQPNPVGPRTSIASLAVITREHGNETQWLARWNDHWRYLHLVGGHKEDDEGFRQCLVREVQEETGLTESTHYQITGAPVHLEYRYFSQAHQQETDYTLELFRVKLTERGSDALEQELTSLLRWLTEMEIRSGQAGDGRPVSPTMCEILTRGKLW